MWLVYPVTRDDIRRSRQGIILLLVASAVWYLTLALVLAIWADPVLYKVKQKFLSLPHQKTVWPPFLTLMVGFLLAGGLRLLGYRLCRNVAGAVGAADGIALATIGALAWISGMGTLYFGFSGLLAVVMVFGTAGELRFVRFAAALFGMVISPKQVRRLTWFFYARTAWLAIVLFAGLLMLCAHILTDIPKNPGRSWEQSVANVNNVLRIGFNVLAVTAIVTLPVITAAYWMILLTIRSTVGRLLDPTGPAVTPVEPPREGYDLLKQVLNSPRW